MVDNFDDFLSLPASDRDGIGGRFDRTAFDLVRLAKSGLLALLFEAVSDLGVYAWKAFDRLVLFVFDYDASGVAPLLSRRTLVARLDSDLFDMGFAASYPSRIASLVDSDSFASAGVFFDDD